MPNRIANEQLLSYDQLVDKLRYTPLTDNDVNLLERNHSNENKKIKYWGYITAAETLVPEDPHILAAASPDPYAPYAYNHGIQWESYSYDDGTLYEGTMTENFPHGRGVLSVGFAGGGGLLTGATSNETHFGDIYEGEFNMGFVHGMGRYVNRNGFIYTGEFMAGIKHGCGELKDLGSYLNHVRNGVNPVEAWQISVKEIETIRKSGTWLNDYFSELAIF